MSVTTATKLIPPCGGSLIDLVVPGEAKTSSLAAAKTLPSIQLSERCLCDLEILAFGGFSPLDRFMSSLDYDRVLADMRLANGHLFPIPITLPVSESDQVKLDSRIALRNLRNEIVATMLVEEIYEWDFDETAQQVFGTLDTRHPLVAEMHSWGKRFISGPIEVIQPPVHYDFCDLRLTPSQTRERLQLFANDNVVAFQTRNPLHRAHEEMTKRAVASVNGVLLLHPVVGLTRSGDIDHFTRVRSYKVLTKNHYEANRTLLALLPLAMRMAGPREAVWHALIRRNYGANHMIVGRDHAGAGDDSAGNPFYAPFAAQELMHQFENELGVRALSFGEFVYLPKEERYEDSRFVPAEDENRLSGTEVRKLSRKGENLPAWFTRKEVAEVLEQAFPPLHKQGFCVWFTGLSSAGKSTTAEILSVLLREFGRQVTLLDGDVVRTNLSKGLGFGKEDRDLNIRRIGFVASEIVKHHGAVICAAVSPYRATRNDVRSLIGTERFVEVFVDTPIEECERRDAKGMYEKARRGELNNFTGIDDPYEPPLKPELTLHTLLNSAEDNAAKIVDLLRERGFVK